MRYIKYVTWLVVTHISLLYFYYGLICTTRWCKYTTSLCIKWTLLLLNWCEHIKIVDITHGRQSKRNTLQSNTTVWHQKLAYSWIKSSRKVSTNIGALLNCVVNKVVLRYCHIWDFCLTFTSTESCTNSEMSFSVSLPHPGRFRQTDGSEFIFTLQICKVS